MLLCEHCIEELRSRGEIVGQYELFCSAEECDEMERTCEWCDEEADLYECVVLDGYERG